MEFIEWICNRIDKASAKGTPIQFPFEMEVKSLVQPKKQKIDIIMR